MIVFISICVFILEGVTIKEGHKEIQGEITEIDGSNLVIEEFETNHTYNVDVLSGESVDVDQTNFTLTYIKSKLISGELRQGQAKYYIGSMAKTPLVAILTIFMITFLFFTKWKANFC